jgi:hypothetical protein
VAERDRTNPSFIGWLIVSAKAYNFNLAVSPAIVAKRDFVKMAA